MCDYNVVIIIIKFEFIYGNRCEFGKNTITNEKKSEIKISLCFSFQCNLKQKLSNIL